MSEDREQPIQKKWELGWTLKGFNGPLRRARKAKGFSQKQLAAALSVSPNFFGQIELLLRRPDKNLRQNIAELLGIDEQDVWPDWLEPRDKSLTAIAYQEVDAKTFSMLDSKVRREVLQLEDHSGTVDGEMTREMVRERLEAVMKTLSYREREVLRLRYGLNEGGYIYTLEECGRILKHTRERIRQIELKALRKLQRPDRAKALESATEEVFGRSVCVTCGTLYDMARFCSDCKSQGCNNCFRRINRGGEYVYLCKKCLECSKATAAVPAAAVTHPDEAATFHKA